MLIKILGILDIISAIVFLLFGFFRNFLPDKMLWVFAIYLLVKGGIFLISADFMSIFDVVVGLFFILLIFFPLFKPVILIIFILLLQKGIFSLLS